MSKKRKISKRKPTQYTPNTKQSRIQQVKGLYKPGNNAPTIDTFSEILSTDEFDYDLPEDNFDFERPSEKGFSFEEFWKPTLISISVAIFLGIGGWILSHHLKIALLEQDNKTQETNIQKNEGEIKEIKSEIEDIKSEQKLENYRLDQLEKNNNGSQ